MIGQATSRVALWGSSVIAAAGFTGLSWTGQTVDMPIVWLLVLTFVPTSDLIDVVRSQLDKFQAKHDTN